MSIRVGWLGHKSSTIGDGLRTYSRNVTRSLTERGIEVVFVHHEPAMDDGRSSFSLRGSPVFQRRLVIARVGSAARLQRILRESRVDIVHVSVPFSTMDFRLPRLCHAQGIPVVATFHVPFGRRFSRWEILSAGVHRLYVRALSACDAVVVLGSQQRDLLASLGVPEALMTVLPNGVDIDRYSPGPSAFADELGAERIFTYIGRIDAEKRVEAIIRAYLEAQAPSTTRLVIVGDGFDLPRLRRRYRDPRVVFTGPVLDESVRIDILRASDAFFLPSRLEAQSLALTEAMACGAAVVATPVGNHFEVLDGAGAMVRPDCLAQDLRKVMVDLLRSHERCRKLGAQARSRALERFDLSAHVDGLVGAYGSVIENRASRLNQPTPLRTPERTAAGG